jgi:hypothetical protein
MSDHKLPEGAATNRGVEVMEQWCDGTAQPIARDVRRLIARIRHEAARVEKAERERGEALSREASLCDLLNTWARESNVEEAERQEEAKAVADRLWHAASSRINALERERDGYVKLLREALSQRDELREALAYIASEESGWGFKWDPLEHTRSVIEEMRAMAQDVLAALDSGSGGAATRKDAGATPSGEAYQAAPGAADSTEGNDGST